MNKRGFTLVELITTFLLSSVIIILLLNVAIVIRNIYSKTNVKTNLYITQSSLSNNLNKTLGVDNISSYVECNDTEFCYDFNLATGSTVKLAVSGDTILFGNATYKLDNLSKVVNPSIETINITDTSESELDSFLVIKIPIVCELYPGIDFGINLVYLYNSNEINL